MARHQPQCMHALATMQITGESLMNDGTAIVIFTLFFNMYHDCTKLGYETYTTSQMVSFFLRMALGGPVMGLFFGGATLFWVKKVTRKTSHTDLTVQIALTLCCAYLSFYIGEGVAHVSGVLCTVTAGV